MLRLFTTCCRRRKASGEMEPSYGYRKETHVIACFPEPSVVPQAKTVQIDVDPMMALLPEIMSKIFVECIPEDPSLIGRADEAPINLSQVNRAWRDIAIHTPELWSNLVLCTDRLYYHSHATVMHKRTMPLHAWKLWSQRSQSRTTSVYIQKSHWDKTVNPDGYLGMLCEGGRRWRELCLSVGSTQSLVLHPESIEQLEVLCTKGFLVSFSLHGPHTKPLSPEEDFYSLTTLDLTLPSKLRHIDFQLGHIPTRWNPEGIVEHSAMINFRMMMALLRGASSHLSFLAFSLAKECNIISLEPRVQPVVMTSLRTLILHDNVPATRLFLDHITAPALEKLWIELCESPFPSDPPTRHDLDCLLGFLSRSNPPLADLKVRADGYDGEDMRRILGHAPKLRKLIIDTNENRAFWTEANTTSFIGELMSGGVCPELMDVKLHHLPVSVNLETHSAAVNDTQVIDIMSEEATERASLMMHHINKYTLESPHRPR